jgi:hypothetical protein
MAQGFENSGFRVQDKDTMAKDSRSLAEKDANLDFGLLAHLFDSPEP